MEKSAKVYTNPPLREAIFDLRFNFRSAPTLEIFEAIAKELAADYPKKTSIQSGVFQLSIAQDGPQVTDNTHQVIGVRLDSEDGTRVVQMRTDGFTFSRLKPYSKWEEFSEEAERLLELYLQKVDVEYINRLALRYINAIDIPESNFQLEQYFATSPKIAEGISKKMLHFFSRLVLQDNASDTTAIINQTTEQNEKPQITTVLFDIDAFQQNLRIVPKTVEFETVINQIKDYRTLIFERSLTEKTKKLFE